MLNLIYLPIFKTAFITVGSILGIYIIGLLIEIALNTKWLPFMQRHKWNIIVTTALKKTLIPISIVAGLIISLQFWDLPERIYLISDQVLFSVLILFIVLFLMVVTKQSTKTIGASEDRHTPATTLIKNVINIIILILGLLVILGKYGVSITPILAAVGVGGLAVALALQQTLTNLFAGIHISLAGKLKAADYIKLDSGEEGYIKDISWREITLRATNDNIISIPNGKLANASITFLNLPNRAVSFSLNLKIAYESDLEQVERVTLEVAKDVQNSSSKASTASTGFIPVVQFTTLGDLGITLNVTLRPKTYEDQASLKHEFIKCLLRRYQTEKIVIPTTNLWTNLNPSLESGIKPS